MARNHHTITNLKTALETYTNRNRVYGNNYKRFGAIMVALYPDGVTLETVEDHNRFGVIIQMISKLSRYVTDPKRGHLDSIHDLGVYSMMLEELDAEAQGLDVESPIRLVTTVKDAAERRTVLPGACEHIYLYPCSKLPEVRQCKPQPVEGKVVQHTCGKPVCTVCGERPEHDSI